MACRFLGVMAIAAVTAATTISVTNYLLGRPWCIHIDAGGHQTIEYGQSNCIRESRIAGQPSL